jgi:hypothetical protein
MGVVAGFGVGNMAFGRRKDALAATNIAPMGISMLD